MSFTANERGPRHPDGTRPSTLSVAKTLGAVSAIGALVARRWQLVHVIVGDGAVRGGGLMHDFRKIGADDLLLRIAGGTQCIPLSAASD